MPESIEHYASILGRITVQSNKLMEEFITIINLDMQYYCTLIVQSSNWLSLLIFLFSVKCSCR